VGYSSRSTHIAYLVRDAYHAHMTTAYEGGHVPPLRLKYRLRIAREEAGLDQQELADRMGVGRAVISNSENGRSVPRKIVLNAWALGCGVPISWLEKGVGAWNPDDGNDPARPKGFEPPTFCTGVSASVTRLFPRGVPAETEDRIPAC
jgi:transcriptional regulator with XRE-family HTH domain